MTASPRRLQTAATVLAICGFVLGFFAGIGLRLLPALDPQWIWWLALPLFALGVGGGLVTVLRGREIDRIRWQTVEDPLLTSGEREWAHKHAERERRWAGTVLFGAPIGLTYWLANQITSDPTSGTGAGLTLGLMAVWPLLGFPAGLFLGLRKFGPEPPTDSAPN